MAITINFREELELLPETIEFPLVFTGKGQVMSKTVRFNLNFLRELQEKKRKHDHEFQPSEEAQDDSKLPDTKNRYYLTVFDLKKNFNYSTWKRDEWKEN